MFLFTVCTCVFLLYYTEHNVNYHIELQYHTFFNISYLHYLDILYRFVIHINPSSVAVLQFAIQLYMPMHLYRYYIIAHIKAQISIVKYTSIFPSNLVLFFFLLNMKKMHMLTSLVISRCRLPVVSVGIPFQNPSQMPESKLKSL